jgi:hypothetical protein
VKRGKVIDRLKQMGVSEERILAVVEARTVEDIDQEKLGILIGLGTSLKDGETTIEEAFPPKPAAPGKPAFPPGPGAAEPPDDVPMGGPPAKAPAPAQVSNANPLPAVVAPSIAGVPGTSLERASAPPATDSGSGPVPKPGQAELQAFLDANGIVFPALAAWAVSTDWEPGWDSYASLDDVPARSIARLNKSKAGLLRVLGPQTPATAATTP